MSQTLADLLSRYDVPVPRYTSYPTVPTWTTAAPDLVAAAHARARGSAPVSVYVHVPFCQRMCLYCGCNVIVARQGTDYDRYIEAIRLELDRTAAAIGDRPLLQLHFGGGTPTSLSPERLERVVRHVTSHFRPAEHAELGIEIDPVTTTEEHLAVLRRLGFNRLSMGVQDFDDNVQRLVERNQPAEVSRRCFAWARSAGFSSINLDLMYGLPGQTPESVARSADEAIALGADRLALFGYAHVPAMKPHQKKLEQYGMPTSASRWRMFAAARERLLAAGYVHIGLDHFARETDELVQAQRAGRLRRNFQGYTVCDATELVAVGVSAISDLGGAYLQNAKRLSAYYAAVESGCSAVELGYRRTAEDDLRRDLIMSVMCNMGLERAGLETEFKEELKRLEPFRADGLVTVRAGGFAVTDAGRPFLRNIASVFDAYLPRSRTEAMAMSRAV